MATDLILFPNRVLQFPNMSVAPKKKGERRGAGKEGERNREGRWEGGEGGERDRERERKREKAQLVWLNLIRDGV